jgi:MFS family permease
MLLNLYINRYFGDLVPIVPLVGLLLHERGFSLGDISLFFLCMSVTVLLFEIPFGVLADKTNPRLVIILSRFAKLTAFIFLLFSHSSFFVLLSAVCWGIASALDSGAIQAYTYALTYSEKSAQSFQVVYGRLFTSSLLGLLTAGLIAAQVEILGFDTIQYVGIFALTVCVLSSMFLPKVKEVENSDAPPQKIKVKILISKPVLLVALLVGIFAGGVKGSLDEYTALLLSAKGLSYGLVGYVLFGLEIMKTLGATVASKFKIGLRIQVGVLLFLGLSFVGVFYGNYIVTILLLIFVLFFDSILWVHNDVLIQMNAPDAQRSTVASVKNFGIEFLATLSFLMAWLYSGVHWSPEHLYRIGGVVLVLVSILAFLYERGVLVRR